MKPSAFWYIFVSEKPDFLIFATTWQRGSVRQLYLLAGCVVQFGNCIYWLVARVSSAIVFIGWGRESVRQLYSLVAPSLLISLLIIRQFRSYRTISALSLFMELYYSFSVLIVLASFFAYLNLRYLKLPATIGVMLIAILVSVLL